MLSASINLMREEVSMLTHRVKLIFKQIVLVLILFFSVQNQTLASSLFYTDSKLGFNGRSYPFGIQLTGTFGAAVPIWGDHRVWKYGYLRGAINVATSAVINRIGGEVQFFPISILGLSAGYDLGWRSFEPRWMDCVRNECNGRVDRAFFKVQTALAYSGVSLVSSARYEHIRGYASSRPLFDEVGLLITKPSGENELILNSALLYQATSRTNVGIASLLSRATQSGGNSHLYGPVVVHNWDTTWNGLFGVGLNSAPVAHSAISGFFMIQYMIKPSLSVLDMKTRNELF